MSDHGAEDDDVSDHGNDAACQTGVGGDGTGQTPGVGVDGMGQVGVEEPDALPT